MTIGGSTTVKFNLWCNGKRYKGLQFADVVKNPEVVSKVLDMARTSYCWQMPDLLAYISQWDDQAESHRMRAVFWISEDSAKKEVVSATYIARLVAERGVAAATAGGFRCDHGHRLKFVNAHMSTGHSVCPYFAHVVTTTKHEDGNGHSLTTSGNVHRRGCSDTHFVAQLLVKEHIKHISLKRFAQCGNCVDHSFGPEPNATAEIEVSGKTSDGGRMRSDIVVSVNGVWHTTIEIKHTHATSPSDRNGVEFYEINAGHVINMLYGDSSKIRELKCENSTAVCTMGCNELLDQKEKHYKRKRKKRKSRGTDNRRTGMGNPVMGDSEQCANCGEWKDYLCSGEDGDSDHYMCMTCITNRDTTSDEEEGKKTTSLQKGVSCSPIAANPHNQQLGVVLVGSG